MRLQKISCNAAEYTCTCTVDTPLDEEILFLNLAYCFRHKLYKLASTHRWARYFKKVAERALNAKKFF